MKIKYLLMFLLLMFALDCKAYEEYLLTTTDKLTDIKVEDKQIVDVYPIVTIMNNKNNLIIHPNKVGETKFSVVKNSEKYEFNVKITEDDIQIESKEGFTIISIDNFPPILDCNLDLPPEKLNEKGFVLDSPPKLREVK